MIFPRWKIALFVAAAVVGVLALVALPGVHEGDFDPRTGRVPWQPAPPQPPPPPPPSPLERGDAAAELARLRTLPPARRAEAADALAALEAEFAPLSEIVADDPRLRRLREPMSADELIAVLGELHGSAVAGDAVEAYFDVPVRELREGWVPGPDGVARAVLDRIRAGEDAPAVAYLLAARSFREGDRPRGRLRWLLRAFARFPEVDAVRAALLGAFVEGGRLEEALALSSQGVGSPDNGKAFWRQRATLAAWLSRSEIEAEALERLLATGPDNETRQRLLQIYGMLGRQDDALRHAIAMAEEAGELAAYERAAYVALENGRTDAALALLAELARRSNDPARWRERIVDYALQDMQFDRAIAELERLLADHPDIEYHQRLEGLYRRRDQPRKLAGLLEQRIRWEPENAALVRETTSLWIGLGDRERARRVLALQRMAERNPQPVPRRVAPPDADSAAKAQVFAESLLGANSLQPSLLGEALQRLRPFLRDAKFRSVVEDLLRRYPDEPAARAMRLEMLDLDHTPAESARLAEELVATYPDDVETVRAWVDRAAWAGLLPDEIRARERLLALQPDDRLNRQALADLLEADQRLPAAIEHWQALVDREGLRSTAMPRLIGALFGAGRHEEALRWLRERAADPQATLADRLMAAEELFQHGRYDQAAMLLRAVLEASPDHPLALLRLGQIHSWTNDPHGALPYLRRRLEVSELERSHVEHLLGEALWAVGQHAQARELLSGVLESLRAAPNPDVAQRAAIARILVRLGRPDEALPLFRALVEGAPKDLDLLLDFAGLCLQTAEHAEARELIARARALDGDDARVLRLEGELAMAEKHYGRAAERFGRLIELHGPDAGTLADLGNAHESDDRWYDALQAFRRWLELRSDSQNAAQSVHRLENRIAPRVVARTELSRVGNDSIARGELGGVLPLDDDRTALALNTGIARFEGRAQAVASGMQDVTEEVALLDLGLDYRTSGSNTVGAGVSVAAGAAEGTALGGWVDLYLAGNDPFQSVELHAYANRLLTEPAAAAGLGGRVHGVELTGYRESGAWWLGAVARARHLTIEPPGSGSVSDPQLAGELSIGRLLITGDAAVAGRFDARRTPPGPSSPFLAAERESRDLMLNVWASVQAFRLLGGADLAQLVPIAEHSEYALVAGRIDKHLRDGLGAKLEAHAGMSFSGRETVWGIDGGVTWQAAARGELTLIGSVGESLNRSGFDASAQRLELQFVWRW
jgi:tetratricopeptide (TPR) repeat protein